MKSESKPVRNVVRHGDETTAGGSVIAPGSNHTVFGKQIALEGDSVSCPACNSTGLIKSVAPKAENYHDGRRYAFGGDLCMCLCATPPRLIATCPQWTVSSFKTPIAQTPDAADWLIFAGHTPHEHGLAFDRFVALKDKAGNPLANASYKITLATGHTFVGTTDAAGHTEKVFSNADHTATIEAPYYGNTDDTTHTPHGSDTCGC